MAVRIISGLIMAAGAILLLTLAPPVWTYALIQVAVMLVADEFYRITLGAERKRERAAGVIAIGALAVVTWWFPAHILHALVALPPIMLSVVLFSSADVKTMGPRAATMVAGVAYLGLALVPLTLLAASGPKGPLFVLALFGAVFGGDTGAYFSGKFLGKKKLYEKISPKKTWAGSYGGATASVVGFLLINALAGLGVPVIHGIALGLCCGVAGQIGDLAESLFKRAYGVKDSGTILPGHGGMWDRIDGIMFGAPFMWLYTELFLPI